ncbi:MAG: Hsp33 family molecular chaperone HslO [Clostridia bacterium]|nr:Hsp33 family molecular chaperone HslO [Clostridia bacterium]
MQKSKILKTLVWGDQVSLAVLDTTALVNEAISRHALSPVAAAALGRTLTATAYLCSWLKGADSSLSVSINGGGAGGKICVSGDGNLNLRGFIENAGVQLPPRKDGKLDVGACVGNSGTITVVRDDKNGLPFTGTSELVSGEIAEDFSAYFLTSEQRPTAVALGVKIGTNGKCIDAGGLFLQPLPYADEEILLRTENEIKKYAALSSMIAEKGAEGIIESFEHTALSEREVSYRCFCSRKKTENLLLSLGEGDAKSLLLEQGKISVHCDYCNTDYVFDERAVTALFSPKESK